MEEIKKRNKLKFYNNETKEYFPTGYMCPITFDFYNHSKYDELSVEHVPQKSLGGQSLCLTDKKWNNSFGKYDKLALERVKELYNNRVKKISTGRAKFSNGITGNIQVNLEGKPTIKFISPGCKTDNPIFEEFLSSMNNKGEFKVDFKPNGQLTKYVKLAYLKNAYLILFSHFGYSTIFGEKGIYKIFSEIRNQLRNPDKDILPSLNFIGELNPANELDGVYIINYGKERALGVFYKLRYHITVTIGVIFPSLSLTESSYFRWDQKYENIDFTKINKQKKLLPLELLLEGEKADFIPLEYDN